MNVFVANEGENCWIPGIQADEFPDGLPSAVSLLTKSGQIGVRFDGVVGSVGLRSGDLILVKPKIGDVNFLRLVAYSTGGNSLLEKIESSTRYNLSESNNAAPVFASEFLDCAHRTLRTGMQHERSWRVRTGRELQGRIDLVLTQQRIAVMNDKPVVARVKQRSFDTPENRLTSLALVAAEGLLERDQIEELRFVRRRWPCSPPTIKQALEDVEVVQRRMLNNHYRGVRAYYRELVGLSQIVLNISGFGNGQDHSLSGRSFLVNTAQVFEAFVLRAVMETFSGLDVIVTKGGSDVRSLYTDGSFGLNPDVVIERDGRCVAVLDAKYKAPTSNDHYQMMSYIENFGVKGGALIRPTYAKEIPGVKKFKTSTGKSVDVVSVDLTNLEDAVTDIHNFVRSFV